MSILISTAYGATSNSYISLADANIYLDDTLDDEWLSYGDQMKEKALIQATKQIERRWLRGVKYDTTTPQALHFPTTDDYDGITEDYIVPISICEATCEQALYLLKQKENADLLDRRELQNQGVSSISLDGISESYRGKIADGFSAEAKLLLSPFEYHQARITGRGNLS